MSPTTQELPITQMLEERIEQTIDYTSLEAYWGRICFMKILPQVRTLEQQQLANAEEQANARIKYILSELIQEEKNCERADDFEKSYRIT